MARRPAQGDGHPFIVFLFTSMRLCRKTMKAEGGEGGEGGREGGRGMGGRRGGGRERRGKGREGGWEGGPVQRPLREAEGAQRTQLALALEH